VSHDLNPWQPPFEALGRRRFLYGLALGAGCGALATWLFVRRSPVPTESPTSGSTADVPSLDHAKFMRRAIEQARKVPDFPFGAVIVRAGDGEVVAEGHNRSLDNPTYHGEMVAINNCAARHPGIAWEPLVLYTTAEPCPMCQSAIEWAGIGAVVFGSSIPFLKDLGWWQIDIRADEVIRRTTFRRTRLLGGVLETECNALFQAVPRGPLRDKPR